MMDINTGRICPLLPQPGTFADRNISLYIYSIVYISINSMIYKNMT
jgi:hypothetical protein